MWKLKRVWIFLEHFVFHFIFFSLSCVLLVIQTERTIHYKSLFHNGRHSFRGSAERRHTTEKKLFSFFFHVRLVFWWVASEENLNEVEKLYRKSSRCYQTVNTGASRERSGIERMKRSREERETSDDSKSWQKLVWNLKSESKKWNGNERWREAAQAER